MRWHLYKILEDESKELIWASNDIDTILACINDMTNTRYSLEEFNGVSYQVLY